MASKVKRSPAAALTNLRDRVRTDGVEAAYEALVAVCRDPKAPAQARATASTTLFRAAGMLERFEDDLDDIEVGDMTWDQLQRTIIQGARETGAPDDLIDAVADIGSDRPASDLSVEAAPARRQRRAAAAPGETSAPAGSPLDDFG